METLIAELCKMKRKQLEAANKEKECKDDDAVAEPAKGDKNSEPQETKGLCENDDGVKCFEEYEKSLERKVAKKCAKLCPTESEADKSKKICDEEKDEKNAKDSKKSEANRFKCSLCQDPSPPILATAPKDGGDRKSAKTEKKDSKKNEESDRSLANQCKKPAKTEKKDSKKKEESDLSLANQCKKPAKTEKKDSKENEESDLSLANQCNKLCAECNSTKTIPYKEGKEFEKCVDPELLICEEKIVGKCHHLICKPMEKPKPLSEMEDQKKDKEKKKNEEKKDEKGARLLKCKAVLDESGKEILICKAINLNSNKDAEKQIEEETKKAKDDCGKKHKKKSKNVTVAKKLVCKEEEIATTNSKEMCCNVLEVREIIDSDGSPKIIKKKAGGRKPSPFTYQDLLKKSEEVRRATEEELAREANKKSNKKNINNC